MTAANMATPISTPLRDGSLTVEQLVDLYMASYTGRDPTRVPRLAWWCEQIGNVRIDAIDDDHIHAGAQALNDTRARFYAGKDIDGRSIFKPRKGQLSGASINRYLAAIASVFTWAIRRRITPKGFVHPVRIIERNPESPGKTRYLSPDERRRLLAACQASKWPRLYLFVLLALTTGARRGELLALRWRDVDLSRKELHIERSKNTDKKVLPLVGAVLEQIERFKGEPDALVFPAKLQPHKPMALEDRWRQALALAKIRGFRLHDLRHTTASYLAQSGATPLEIADLLGHRTMAMVKRYSHLNSGHRSALVERVMGDVR